MITNQNLLINLIAEIEDRILGGGEIKRHEAESLWDLSNDGLMKLVAAADRIRINFLGDRFDSCSLINAKSGRCSEDCAFCAQSAAHNGASEVYGLRSTAEILEAARAAKAFGAGRFCTVTSGGALSEQDFDRLIDSLRVVKSEVDIALDASLGFLNEVRAAKLFGSGVTRYNHNLESSKDFYPSICSTHSFESRVNTVKLVKAKGASVCCGGIIGLGETPSQRLELGFTLADLGVDCVPINILNPRPGTPLQDYTPPPPLEILKTIALFRFILPSSTIKVAGGREKNLGDFQAMALRSGANGMIIGGYLTTKGRSVEDDLKMIRDAGFKVVHD
ncbi:MAG: biotin synthase BioB [Desulfomonilaceae bacterium]